MSAAALKERLRTDLKAAMRARAADEVRALRVLIAALDNAEAVPGEGVRNHRALGDPSGEVPRRELDEAELDALLASEMESRLAAAADYEGHGQIAEAARLRAEAVAIERYRAP